MMASTAQALMAVAGALLVILVSRVLFKRPKLNLPPGPTALPIIGCLHLLGKQPHKDLATLARKYGPIMSVPLGQKYCVVATSPEAAKEFLQLQDANFCARPLMRSAEILLTRDINFHDITPVNRHLRKILVRELISAKRVEESKHIRAEEIAYMLSAIAKERGQPVRVSTHVSIMSSNILTRMVLNKPSLGEEDQSDARECIEIIEKIAFVLGAIQLQDVFDFVPEWFDPRGLGKRARKLRVFMKAFYRNMVNKHQEERRKNPASDGEKTLVDVLLEQLENPDYEITEECVEGVIWNIFGAGTDTTAVTVEWAMAEVLRNPSVAKKARAELDHVVGSDRAVQESDILHLRYIQAVVKETLRLHATVPMLIPHQSINAARVFGYDIPAKTRVIVNVWAIGRDPAIWENPLDFTPERFLQGGAHAATELHGQHFEFLPFGAGRRQCPGMMFGLVAVHLQVASLLHAFDWSLPNGMPAEKLDMADGAGLTPPLQTPLVVVGQPRLPPHLYQPR